MAPTCKRCRVTVGPVYFILRASVATSSPAGAEAAVAYLGLSPTCVLAREIEERPGPVGDVPGMHWTDVALCPTCFALVAPYEIATSRSGTPTRRRRPARSRHAPNLRPMPIPAHRAGDVIPASPGMTLRDYFAGQALANSDISACARGGAEGLAALCYEFADAMVAARDGWRS